MYYVHLLHAHTCTSVVAFNSIAMFLHYKLKQKYMGLLNMMYLWLEEKHELFDFFYLERIISSIHLKTLVMWYFEWYFWSEDFSHTSKFAITIVRIFCIIFYQRKTLILVDYLLICAKKPHKSYHLDSCISEKLIKKPSYANEITNEIC